MRFLALLEMTKGTRWARRSRSPESTFRQGLFGSFDKTQDRLREFPSHLDLSLYDSKKGCGPNPMSRLLTEERVANEGKKTIPYGRGFAAEPNSTLLAKHRNSRRWDSARQKVEFDTDAKSRPRGILLQREPGGILF